MLERGLRSVRHMGHVGFTCEDEAQVLRQADPKMWPQRSEMGFSARASSVKGSMQMVQFWCSSGRSRSWSLGRVRRKWVIDGSLAASIRWFL